MKRVNAAALSAYASKLTGGGREMIELLVTIARAPETSEAGRLAAIRELLDRTCGRSAQVIEHEVTVVGQHYDLSKLPTSRVQEIRAMLSELALTAGDAAPTLVGDVIDVQAVEE
jgi:hypothetical protein